jgi:xanthine/uracil permease
MRRRIYFTAVAITAAASATLLVLRLTAPDPTSLPIQRLSAFGNLFGSSVPLPLAQFVPEWVVVALAVLVLSLSVRRLGQSAASGTLRTPPSLGKWPVRLLVLALASFSLCVVSILAAHVTKRTELVPIGFILGWPAAMLLAPVVTYVEASDVWQHAAWFPGRKAPAS